MDSEVFDFELAVNKVNNCNSVEQLENVRIEYLGKSGAITTLLKSLSKLDSSQRSVVGAKVNKYKTAITAAIKSKQHLLQQAEESIKLLQDQVDITLPGAKLVNKGAIHPVMQTQIQLENIFSRLGFSVIAGEFSHEIETDYYNFTALNIPKSHPARAMHDTFYMESGGLLRTHTSAVQIRMLEQNSNFPLRMVTPGKVYRCDSDQTHTPMFHQMEGLVVDEVSNFSNLKWLIKTVLNEFFATDVELRFRPSYFPFTEPSAEVDIRWPLVGGKDSKWLEVLGCGMVHPNVLHACGVDVDVYQGYAFGFGLDRLTMLRYDIEDLRSLFTGDISFLEQFA